MRTFLVVAALASGFGRSGCAQDLGYAKPFPESVLVLTTGAMLSGPLVLYPQTERVSITCANDSIYTLPAQLVQGFAVKEPLLARPPSSETYVSAERVFRVFPLATGNHAHLPGWGFYEQLSHGPGPVLLLRREQALPYSQAFVPPPPNAGAGIIRMPMRIGFVYQTTLYLRTAAGAMVRLRKPKHLLKYLPQQAPLLRAYIRENKLHYDNLRELSFIINYANTLP